MMKCIYVKNYAFDDSYVGGARAHITGMANGFLDAGLDVSFVTDVKLTGIRAEQKVVIPFDSSKKRRYFLHRAFDKAAYKGLMSFIQSEGNDFGFMYSRMRASAPATMRVSRKTGIPYITEYNSSGNTGWREVQLPRLMKSRNIIKKLAARVISPFRIRFTDRREMQILSNAEYVVTVSEILATELVSRGIDKSRIIVCPNGVDTSVFVNDAAAGKAIKREHGIPEESITVGFSGTFGKWHGIPEITEAIGELCDVGNLSFLLVGDGILKKEMEQKLKDRKNVCFAGSVPFQKMPAYLSACDILLVANSWNPSDDKPFFGSPTKMFEYMSMGKAIVASDLTQIGDFFSDSVDCIKFESGNAHSLATAIRRAAGDAALRETLGANARQTAIDKHTWKSNAQRILEKKEATNGERVGN